jgi:hypothetical protein
VTCHAAADPDHHLSRATLDTLASHSDSQNTDLEDKTIQERHVLSSVNPLKAEEREIEKLWGDCKVKLSMCLTNCASHHEDLWGSGCIDPRILDPGTSWSLPYRFTPGEKPPVPIG